MTIYRKNDYYHEMRSLEGAIQRCHNPNHKSYSKYGERGITVCDEWRGRGAFQRFMEHIGPKPQAGLTLDRIHNDRGYERGNVRWATYSVQNKNRRKRLH